MLFLLPTGYVLDDFPCVSEEFLTIKQQLDFIKSWSLKPDFILHLKVGYKIHYMLSYSNSYSNSCNN